MSDIAFGELDPPPGRKVCVAASRRILFMDREGNVRSEVIPSTDRPEGGFGFLHVVDVEGDGVCEYRDTLPEDSAAALLDHSGRVLWSQGEEDHAQTQPSATSTRMARSSSRECHVEPGRAAPAGG